MNKGEHMYKRILVPVDGSAASMQGMDEALKVASEQGSRLRIVNVVDEMVLAQSIDMFAMGNTANLIDMLRESGKKALDKAVAVAAKRDVKVDTAIRDSGGRSVSDVILDEASTWRADLIVMGTHGRRGMNRMLLGSDAERVLRDAPVPVLLVRGTPSRKATKRASRR
jgi:nucleotide-binding universal stress UspA family protein